MSDPTNNSEDILKKLSRRNMLRNSAITATGVALLPSLLTSCHKDVWDKVKGHIPGGGLGGALPEPEPTPENLKKAADNITRMEAWRARLELETDRYTHDFYDMINSGPSPSGWESFVVDVFTTISAGIFDAAAAEVEFPAAAPAIAILGATINKWALGQDSPDFPGVHLKSLKLDTTKFNGNFI